MYGGISCWSPCPTEKKGIKASGFYLPLIRPLPQSLPSAIVREKGYLQGSATARTVQSREEWETYLRAKCPGEANHPSLSTCTTTQYIRPLDTLPCQYCSLLHSQALSLRFAILMPIYLLCLMEPPFHSYYSVP